MSTAPTHPRHDRSLRVALAGAGMVSAHHLISWTQTPDAVIVAICDPDQTKAADRARAFGIDAVYGHVSQMLSQQRPDALDIATPPHTHAEIVRLAAGAGVHVLCQKPLCPTLPEAQALVTEVSARMRLMVHENWRFRPYYRQTLAWKQQGLLGHVVQCRLASRSSGLLPVDGKPGPGLVRQPFLATLPKLIVAELLVHHLDVVRLLVGPLRVLACQTRRSSPDVIGEDAATIQLEGPNKATVIVEGDMSAPGCPPLPADTLELIGTAGSIFLKDQTLSLVGSRNEAVSYDLDEAYQQSYTNAIGHFADCLRSGQPFETPAIDHLETLKLVEAAYALETRHV